MTMDWYSSVRNHDKIFYNEAHNQDDQITTRYMIPWSNIQLNLHSERDLFITFCFTEILAVVFGHHTCHAFILTPHIVRPYGPQ